MYCCNYCGSGLTGLATALLLACSSSSHNNDNNNDSNRHTRPRIIHLYERDLSFNSRRDGYGLTLSYHPNGFISIRYIR